MKYKQQLYFIIVFIALRLLTLVLYTFYKPHIPTPYTSYILVLYSLFDVLIICYLYRFVKVIKQHPFNLIPILLIMVGILYALVINWIIFSEVSNLTPMQTFYLIIPASVAQLIGKIMIAIYLIKNKVRDYSRTYIAWIGWAYVVVLITGLMPLANLLYVRFITDSIGYLIPLSSCLPLIAMLMLYIHELRNDSDADYYIGGPTVDSEI